MRLRSDIWVAAYLRRCSVEGAFATLRRRGAPEAGAIFIVLDRLDGALALYGPAPQSETGAAGLDRLWMRMHAEAWVDALEVQERLQKELRFDPDIWIVDIEDRQGRSFLDLAP